MAGFLPCCGMASSANHATRAAVSGTLRLAWRRVLPPLLRPAQRYRQRRPGRRQRQCCCGDSDESEAGEPQQRIDGRARHIATSVDDIGSWAQFFLKYVASHPAVTCAIPGTTGTTHLTDNQGGGRGRLPDAAMRQRMKQYWDGL